MKMKLMRGWNEQGTSVSKQTSNAISDLVSHVSKDAKLLKMFVQEANSRGMCITGDVSTAASEAYGLKKPNPSSELQIKTKKKLETSSFKNGWRFYQDRVRPVEKAVMEYDQKQEKLYAQGID